MATKGRFTPRTKHIALKYHHCRRHVDDGVIEIKSTVTREQTAYILTKSLEELLFCYLRRKLIGW